MFSGSLVALVTPMLESTKVDMISFEALVRWHLSAGTHGLVVGGTTGESATLTDLEYEMLIERALALSAGRVPVIVGTGSNSTTIAIKLTQQAARLGAAACLIVTPYYNKPPQRGLIEHYRAIAESTDIPIILYNVPGRTQCDLLPETVAALAKIKNIIGIKEASGSIERVSEIRRRCPADFMIWSGDDPLALATIQRGGQGVISVTANVAPTAVARVCDLALAGNVAEAAALDASLQPLHRVLFIESNPIPTKALLAKLQRIAFANVRLPLMICDPRKLREVEAIYHAVNNQLTSLEKVGQ